MGNAYAVLKLLHVLSVVVWIGGVMAMATILGRIIRAGDRATLASLLPHTMAYGQKLTGPASILVLLTGIPLVIIGKIGFGTFWVSYGFAGIIVHFVFGGAVLRKRNLALTEAVSASPPDDARFAEAGARMRVAAVIYLLIMVSVIGAMILKPTL
jgi:uncharacterized membrane protein